VEEARRRLFEARDTRERPGLDDKVLTEWNALMLSTLAEAAAATQRKDWLDAATQTGEFLLRELRRPDGRWLRSWQADHGAHTLAFAADHGALIDAFTRLAEATGEARWIDAARDTADALLDLFWDDAEGGLFTTAHDGEHLVARPKDLLDNATPGANSLAAVALVRLSALTGNERHRARAEDILRLLGRVAGQHPTAFGHLLGAVDLVAGGVTEIAIVGDRRDLVHEVARRYLPSAVLAWGERYDSPLWQDRRDGYAYVCREYACRAPVSDADALVSELTA
jgi:uncharacterized protein YyaL (SSP411 family)